MRLSAAVVHSLLLLLLLVPAVSSGDYEEDCDPKSGDHKKCSILQLGIWTNGRQSCSSIFCTDVYCKDNRLFISTMALLRIDKDGLIKERHSSTVCPDGCTNEGNCLNHWKRAKWFKFALPLSEARKALEQQTDIILYLSSHHAESYPPVNFGYQQSNLQLKTSGQVLENVYEHGPFYIPSIEILKAVDGDPNWADALKEGGGGEKHEQIFPSKVRHETYKAYTDFIYKKVTYAKDPSTFWFSSPGIYRLNLKTFETSQIYYDPLAPGVHFLN